VVKISVNFVVEISVNSVVKAYLRRVAARTPIVNDRPAAG